MPSSLEAGFDVKSNWQQSLGLGKQQNWSGHHSWCVSCNATRILHFFFIFTNPSEYSQIISNPSPCSYTLSRMTSSLTVFKAFLQDCNRQQELISIKPKCHKRDGVDLSPLCLDTFFRLVVHQHHSDTVSVCSKGKSVQETAVVTPQQPQPLPAAAASTGRRSAAESRTSLSLLCCSLLLRCHAAASATHGPLAWQQGNPSSHHIDASWCPDLLETSLQQQQQQQQRVTRCLFFTFEMRSRFCFLQSRGNAVQSALLVINVLPHLDQY